MSDLDLVAIQERAAQLERTYDVGAIWVDEEVVQCARDVLALLADREAREQELADATLALQRIVEVEPARAGIVASEIASNCLRRLSDGADPEISYTWIDLKHRLAVAEQELARLREALTDEREMAKQVVETLRDLKANWRTIIEEQDPDGGPLIENILYSAIDDLGGLAEKAQPPHLDSSLGGATAPVVEQGSNV